MLPNRVKHGMSVTVPVVGPLMDWQRNPIADHSGTWEVLDRAPGSVTSWWIHRHNAAGRWESVKVDAEMLEEQAPQIQWDAAAPLNPKVRAGSYSIANRDHGYVNISGYVAGEYGAHNPGNRFAWTITHIPTGLSLPAEPQNLAESKELLGKLGALEPLFVGIAFGERPVSSHSADIAMVKAILQPELVNA